MEGETAPVRDRQRSSAAAAAQAAELADIDLETFLLQLDPWQAPQGVSPTRSRLGYHDSLLVLPRQTRADARSGLRRRVLVLSGTIGVLTIVMLIGSLGLTVIAIVGLIPLIPFGLMPWSFGYRSWKLNRLWERTYRETYGLLCTTDVAVLIADDDLWRVACNRAANESVMEIAGLQPPQSPEQAIRMAAEFWPALMRCQQGDPNALTAGIQNGYSRYVSHGRYLRCYNSEEQYALRARVAALVDFFLDLPEVHPAYRPRPKREVSDHGRRALGYDYRMRAPEDRD